MSLLVPVGLPAHCTHHLETTIFFQWKIDRYLWLMVPRLHLATLVFKACFGGMLNTSASGFL